MAGPRLPKCSSERTIRLIFARHIYTAYDETPYERNDQMFQNIQGRIYFVVDLQVFPVPMPIHDGGDPALTHYAEALTAAINDGLVIGPGKYAIAVNAVQGTWTIFAINED